MSERTSQAVRATPVLHIDTCLKALTHQCHSVYISSLIRGKRERVLAQVALPGRHHRSVLHLWFSLSLQPEFASVSESTLQVS
jgi:hypothetical protein